MKCIRETIDAIRLKLSKWAIRAYYELNNSKPFEMYTNSTK